MYEIGLRAIAGLVPQVKSVDRYDASLRADDLFGGVFLEDIFFGDEIRFITKHAVLVMSILRYQTPCFELNLSLVVALHDDGHVLRRACVVAFSVIAKDCVGGRKTFFNERCIKKSIMFNHCADGPYGSRILIINSRFAR